MGEIHSSSVSAWYGRCGAVSARCVVGVSHTVRLLDRVEVAGQISRWGVIVVSHGGLISSAVQTFRHLLCRGATIALHGNVEGLLES